jgi:uncharacterized protein YndB with AHSA1/START domain
VTDAASSTGRTAANVAPRPAADSSGFTAAAIAAATPDAVFAYFTRADLFAHWFVADGFTTPAAEVRLDPRPGGAISGVMVSDDGTTRIPFRARYGRLDPPHLVQFVFTGPDDTVTLDVRPVPDGSTRIGYHQPHGSAEAVHGARSMLDALTASVAGTAPQRVAGPPQPGRSGLVRGLSLPPGFTAPSELRHANLHAHAISRADLDDDVAGINTSLDIIRRTRGGRWPTGPVTADGNYVDLVWHECEFRDGKSFTYVVRDGDGGYLGCCYLYPVGVRSPLTEDLLHHDVDVSWWVTPDAHRAGHYRALYEALQHWVGTAFPFVDPHYSNIEIPGLGR